MRTEHARITILQTQASDSWRRLDGDVACGAVETANARVRQIQNLVHIQQLYGILYTTTSRPNTNTSTITLYVNSRASFHFRQHVIYQTLKQIPNNRQLDIISRTYIYIHTTNRQQNTQTQYPRHREKPGLNMTQATTTTVLKIQLYGILHHQQTQH